MPKTLEKWPSRISRTLISITTSLVFFFLDFLDAVMCIVFSLLDEVLEGKQSSCYCMAADDEEEEEEKTCFAGENELSTTLRGRKNVFREMGLVRVTRKWTRQGAFRVDKMKNKWSDCGCESCVSWMDNGTDLKLHSIVQEPLRASPEQSSKRNTVENVIFIHGFLSSSSFWTWTVFPNLSEDGRQSYRLFAVDLLGFGRSPKPRDNMYTIKDHVEMIEKSVISAFQLKSFHVVAHSMGCVIALALAAKYSKSVKSVTLIAPPYFSSSNEDASLLALRRLAARRLWPPMLFGSAFMSWYEHLGRCFCFFICRHHRIWEHILKLFTRKRDLPFAIMDLTRHTHHSAWHTMHNVICGGAKMSDKYLETLRLAGVRIVVIQGTRDQVVPLECSYAMKTMDPDIVLDILPNADHNTVIMGREKEFAGYLEHVWISVG